MIPFASFMRPIDRVHAERQILDAFNKQMDWDETNIFFKRMGISKPTFGGGSYSFTDLIRGYLAKCSDEILLDIGQQLGLDTKHDGIEQQQAVSSKYWLTDHFRVFISHVHTTQPQAVGLRQALRRYGISAFVAHEDIDTSDEWREEILKSLMSMDAFVAILTPDLKSSDWTDQEVGVAVARGALLIPINRGLVPYGFLSKYQALSSKGLTAKQVAVEVFQTISASKQTRTRIAESLARLVSTSSDASEALFRIERLAEVAGVDDGDWELVRENVAGNEALRLSSLLTNRLNEILKDRGLFSLETSEIKPSSIDDEIPF
jgi:hypothetical protein